MREIVISPAPTDCTFVTTFNILRTRNTTSNSQAFQQSYLSIAHSDSSDDLQDTSLRCIAELPLFSSGPVPKCAATLVTCFYSRSWDEWLHSHLDIGPPDSIELRHITPHLHLSVIPKDVSLSYSAHRPGDDLRTTVFYCRKELFLARYS